MESVRCVIANMPQQLLVDIVENMVEESGVIEVVERVKSISEIPAVIATRQVDMLILGLQSTDLPGPCVDLMNTTSDLPILGLVDDGRRLAVYLNNVGRNDILKVVNSLWKPGTEKTF